MDGWMDEWAVAVVRLSGAAAVRADGGMDSWTMAIVCLSDAVAVSARHEFFPAVMAVATVCLVWCGCCACGWSGKRLGDGSCLSVWCWSCACSGCFFSRSCDRDNRLCGAAAVHTRFGSFPAK